MSGPWQLCASQPYKVLHRFGNGALIGGYDRPIRATDGYLYGVSAGGGSLNRGKLYRLEADGNGYQLIHDFTGSPDDGYYAGGLLLEGSDGVLYGVTAWGGVANNGTIYSINKNGTGFRLLHSFSLSQCFVTDPGAIGTLIEGSDGLLYGIIGKRENCPPNEFSKVVYRIAKDGSGYQEIRVLNVIADSFQANEGLLEASDGKLYGSAYSGGSFDNGALFRMNRDGSAFEIVRRFHLAIDGVGGPDYGPLLEGPDGRLYGNIQGGWGAVYAINKDGSGLQILHRFRGHLFDGVRPEGGLLLGGDGLLYGTCVGALDNDDNYEIIGSGVFRIATDGSGFQMVVATSGQMAPGLSEVSVGVLGGAFYGSESGGTLFRVNAGGSDFSIITRPLFTGGDGANPNGPLIQGRDGFLYGTTQVGGTNMINFGGFGGTIFKIGRDGTGYEVLHSFGWGEGGPSGRLAAGTNGWLYGATDSGKIFQIKSDGAGYQVLHQLNFDDSEGWRIQDGLIAASDGLLYGVAKEGGRFRYGTLFRMTKDGSGFQVLKSLVGPIGEYPLGGVIEGSDGFLYGTASQGGLHDEGVIFRVGKNGSNYFVLHHFQTDLTARVGTGVPRGTLLEGSDGRLYGSTVNYFGSVIFAINKDGTGFTFFPTGEYRFSTLMEGGDGALYGTDYDNQIFRLNKDGTGMFPFVTLTNETTQGIWPRTALLEAEDGVLYGTTFSGGYPMYNQALQSSGLGLIFKIGRPTPPVIVRQPLGVRTSFGSSATFDVVADGFAPLRYQWTFNGQALTGQTNSTLQIPVVTQTHLGEYAVTITNRIGSLTSVGALLTANLPPVADASATPLLWVSGDGSNALVRLDAGNTSDPDGDPLQYQWFEWGAIHPVATGLVSGVIFPVGSHQIELRVSDGLAQDSDFIAIEVVTASQAAGRLMESVREHRAGRGASLVATLTAAQASLDRGQPVAAFQQLQAFQAQVQSQIVPYNTALADRLLDAARTIIDALEPSRKATPQIAQPRTQQ